MNTEFLTNVLVSEVASVKPFAEEIRKAFDENPGENNVAIEADTPVKQGELIGRQMWLLKLLLYGNSILMTSHDIKVDKGAYSVKVFASRIPENSRDEHNKIIQEVKAKAEKLLQG